MSFHSTTSVKSCRKPKRCHWCSQMIEIGQPKTVVAGTWEGDFFASNLHPECKSALDLYQDKYGKQNDYEWPEEGVMVRGGIENRFKVECKKEGSE